MAEKISFNDIWNHPDKSTGSKIGMSLVLLLTKKMFWLSIVFAALIYTCGGGSGNDGDKIRIYSGNPFAGTWVPRDNDCIYQSVVIDEFRGSQSVKITYKDGDIRRDGWNMAHENSDKSKCILTLYSTGTMTFDDSSLLNATLNGNKLKRSK